jgi:hypothetical protein
LSWLPRAGAITCVIVTNGNKGSASGMTPERLGPIRERPCLRRGFELE